MQISPDLWLGPAAGRGRTLALSCLGLPVLSPCFDVPGPLTSAPEASWASNVRRREGGPACVNLRLLDHGSSLPSAASGPRTAASSPPSPPLCSHHSPPSHQARPDAIPKVVLLGRAAWGRLPGVAVLCRTVHDKHSPTLQASFLTKKLNIGGKRVNLAIWDTAGQERFHALGPIYYRDSNGAILVYDITDEDSFQKVKNWVKELRKMLGNEICLCIVGNKVDMEKERHVSVQEAEAYAESVGAKHYHTSAKLNKGIEELFLDLCKRMIETAQVDERAKGNGPSQSGAARRGVQIIDDEPQGQSAGGCCSSG
ncbi:hypothetical protein FKM82_012623 [Ascaphus truei]